MAPLCSEIAESHLVTYRIEKYYKAVKEVDCFLEHTVFSVYGEMIAMWLLLVWLVGFPPAHSLDLYQCV